MAEGSKESRKDQIRVVDEVPTEVVRLGRGEGGVNEEKGGDPRGSYGSSNGIDSSKEFF
jgi:hypothetical protein